VRTETSQDVGHDLSLDIQGLPPAPDDPNLDAALGELDKQADLDQSMRQQQELAREPNVSTGTPDVPRNQPTPAPPSHP
jgi:hypothetical protein